MDRPPTSTLLTSSTRSSAISKRQRKVHKLYTYYMYSVYILHVQCIHTTNMQPLILNLIFVFFYFLFLCPFPSFLPCFLSHPLSLFPFSSFSFFFISLSPSPSPLLPSPSFPPSLPLSLLPSLPLSLSSSLYPSLPLFLSLSLPSFNIRLPQIVLVLLQDGPRQDWKLSPTHLPSLMMRQTANQSLREKETTVRYFSFTYFSLIPSLVSRRLKSRKEHVRLPRFFWGSWKLL